MIVTEVVAGSPAETAGLFEGDHVIEIAGRPVLDMTYAECRELIRSAGACFQIHPQQQQQQQQKQTREN